VLNNYGWSDNFTAVGFCGSGNWNVESGYLQVDVNEGWGGGGVSASGSTADVTNIVLEWMPLIIVFMMLGLIMGIMKKMSRW
jgi:hypothetical protein